MGNELQLTQSFQEKVFEKIRDSIGDLISDEDLKKLVDAALQKAFFEPTMTSDNWGHKSYGEAWLTKEIRNLLQAKVSSAVSEWVNAHPDEVKKAIDDAIAKGMFGLIMQHFQNQTSFALLNFVEQLKQKGVL